MMNQSEQINELAAALSKAQSQIGPAIKDSVNPFFKSKYADLSSVWSACREALTKHGLSVIQTTDMKDGQMILITTLLHGSGQWIRSSLPILSQKQDAQSIGSAITYMRRYSLAAMVGVTCDDDDDGNAATAPSNKPSQTALQSTISSIQARDLKALLDECGPSYQQKFWSFLKNEVKGVDSLEKIPVDVYPRIKMAIEKKREEYSKELAHA